MGSRSVIAIDPGNDTGWAFYASNGLLVACGLCKPGDYPPVKDALLIVEKPQVYPHEHRVDPNDLITLAVKVGRAEQFYEALGCIVSETLPRQWKQQLPKEVCHNRATAALLLPETAVLERELAKVPVGKQHNVLDAVALGLWFVRAERIRKV